MALLLGLCMMAPVVLLVCASAVPDVIELTHADIPAGFKVAARSSISSSSSQLASKYRRNALSMDSGDAGKQVLLKELNKHRTTKCSVTFLHTALSLAVMHDHVLVQVSWQRW
jgi:hypothetical protein